MKRQIFVVAILATLVMPLAPAEAACPTGTYPWVDSWGNNVCRRFGAGGDATIQGNIEQCPTGSYPWTDSWGNRICRAFGGGADSYDTSKGCPIGFYPWTDSWGNSVCKRF
jgi:hypothetical protein